MITEISKTATEEAGMGEISFADVKTEQTPAELARGQKHLSTEHLLSDLKGRTVSSAFVTFVAQGIQLVLSLVSVMILARLLSPRDFGLFSMVVVVMGYLAVFKDAGLSTATIQREGITHDQVSNLFWINVVLGGAITIVVAAGSPLIAWFYREPRLISMTLLMSVTFLLTGLTVQHAALLKRQMRFTAVAFIQASSMFIGVALTITMALLGYGYWSLAIGNVTTVLVTVILTWAIIPWVPRMPTRRNGTKQLVSFGANLATGGLIWSFARGADSLLIGRFYGANAIGLYSRASALLNRPLEQCLGPISSVFVPTLSRLQSDSARYRRTFLRIFESMGLTSFVCGALLFALSRPLTLVVLGPKWEQVSVIFAAFSIGAPVSVMATASTWLPASQGRGRDTLRSSCWVALITFISFLVGLPFGPAGVAIAGTITGTTIGLPILYYFTGKSGPVSTRDLWITMFRYIPLWLVVCGCSSLPRLFLQRYAPLTQLAICGLAGLLAGGIFVWSRPFMRNVAAGMIDILRGLIANKIPAREA